MCAVGGLARPGDCTVGLTGGWSSFPLRAVLRAFRVGTNAVVELRLRAAPGHPHSKSDVDFGTSVGEL